MRWCFLHGISPLLVTLARSGLALMAGMRWLSVPGSCISNLMACYFDGERVSSILLSVRPVSCLRVFEEGGQADKKVDNEAERNSNDDGSQSRIGVLMKCIYIL